MNSEQQWITEEDGIFARALSTTTTTPSKSLQKDECRSIIQSGIQTIEFTPFTQPRVFLLSFNSFIEFTCNSNSNGKK